jgi:hypothetical protein
MKNYILAIILLSISSFSFDANATEPMQYSVDQDKITTTTAPTSGLLKANCKAFDKDGKTIAGQLVTVDQEFLAQGLYIVEFNLYNEQHNKVNLVKCK